MNKFPRPALGEGSAGPARGPQPSGVSEITVLKESWKRIQFLEANGATQLNSTISIKKLNQAKARVAG